MLTVKRRDKVKVITGDYRGKIGEVIKVFPKENRVIISGVNIVKKHQKPRGTARPGGIIQMEAPIHISNVMLICPKCNQPNRPKFGFLEDGTKVRFCRKCQEMIL